MSNTKGNSQAQQCGLMKFVNDKNTRGRPTGVKCFPQELYGVSRQSPDHFKTTNTLVLDAGYYFGHDHNAKNKSFEYYSQKHFISLSPNKEHTSFNEEYNMSISNNKVAFHKRKGRLSQFMDRNGWMKGTITLMGDERDKESRRLEQKERESRIQTKHQFLATTRKGFFSQEKKTPTNSDYVNKFLLTEKSKIRKTRNDFASIQADKPSRELKKPERLSKVMPEEEDVKSKTFTNRFCRIRPVNHT